MGSHIVGIFADTVYPMIMEYLSIFKVIWSYYLIVWLDLPGKISFTKILLVFSATENSSSVVVFRHKTVLYSDCVTHVLLVYLLAFFSFLKNYGIIVV